MVLIFFLQHHSSLVKISKSLKKFQTKYWVAKMSLFQILRGSVAEKYFILNKYLYNMRLYFLKLILIRYYVYLRSVSPFYSISFNLELPKNYPPPIPSD